MSASFFVSLLRKPDQLLLQFAEPDVAETYGSAGVTVRLEAQGAVSVGDYLRVAYVLRGAADGETVKQDHSVLDYGNHGGHFVCAVLIEHRGRVYTTYKINVPKTINIIFSFGQTTTGFTDSTGFTSGFCVSK